MVNVSDFSSDMIFDPTMIFILAKEVTIMEEMVDYFLSGKLSWDDTLLLIYNVYRKKCLSFEYCDASIKMMPELSLPISLTDQSFIIACILGMTAFLETEVRSRLEEKVKDFSELN